MTALFVPRNKIEVAQELQWEIDVAHIDDAPRIAKKALGLLGDVKEIHGEKHLFIHTLCAYVLDRGRCDSEKQPGQFNELTVSGHFAGINYVQSPYASFLKGLMVDLFDVKIYDPLPEGENAPISLRPPLTIPVSDIQSVMLAPR